MDGIRSNIYLSQYICANILFSWLQVCSRQSNSVVAGIGGVGEAELDAVGADTSGGTTGNVEGTILGNREGELEEDDGLKANA